METECNGAAAESAAGNQVVARARQQQQGIQDLGRQQEELELQAALNRNGGGNSCDTETECNGATAESAADSQAVARQQQQQQQSNQLPQSQAQARETTAAAAEDNKTEVAAAADASAEIARLHAQNQQLSAKLHEESVRVQGFFDAAAVKAAATTDIQSMCITSATKSRESWKRAAAEELVDKEFKKKLEECESMRGVDYNMILRLRLGFIFNTNRSKMK